MQVQVRVTRKFNAGDRVQLRNILTTVAGTVKQIPHHISHFIARGSVYVEWDSPLYKGSHTTAGAYLKQQLIKL